MTQRMMCTECFEVAVPDTVLAGSDRIELAAWCLGVPGVVYCGWRHLSRAKVCPGCGGGELVREARAASMRRGPSFEHGAIHVVEPVEWAPRLGTPRARLRELATSALLLWGLVALWITAGLTLAASSTALALAASLACGTHLAHQGRTLVRPLQASACRAWDERGRPLHIERV